MVLLSKQERSNGDVTSTLLLKNGRASSPTIFSKNFASGSVLSILILTDTVYFTLPPKNQEIVIIAWLAKNIFVIVSSIVDVIIATWLKRTFIHILKISTMKLIL